MRAIVCTRYGTPDVLEIRDVPKPAPSANEVLVAIHAATVNRTDCGILAARPFLVRLMYGILRPNRTILGMEFAGIVEAAGADVIGFRPGDRVFGMLRRRELGAHADYVAVPQDGYIATIPEELSFEQAVICEGAYYARSCLESLNLKHGDRILIYGASGAIGTAAVQLACAMGMEVTAVVATRHLELAKSLGAARVIDYTKEDFTRIGETFDALLDAVGKLSYLRCRRLLKPEARFIATDMGPWGQTLLLAIWSAIRGSKKARVAMPKSVPGFLPALKALMETGEVRAVIDRRYSLENIADAYRYVQTGQKTGIVIIQVR